MVQNAFIFPIILTGCLGLVYGATFEDIKLLETTLFTNYSNLQRPSYNFSEPTIVEFNLNVSDVIEINEIQQILKLFCSFRLTWMDDFLKWDPDSFGGLSKIQVDSHLVWKPYIDLLGSLDDSDLFVEKNARLTVFSNGVVHWDPRQSIAIKCELAVSRFPFDTSFCYLIFVPLKYTIEEVQLEDGMGSEKPYKIVHGEWEFHFSSLGNANFKIDNDNVVSSLKISIQLTRIYMFFLVGALLPIVILSFLNVLAFCLPDDSGEKTSFSITLLLALTVFLTNISGSLPKSSSSVAYITWYITSLLVTSCLIVMTNIFLLYFHHKRKRKEEWERNHGTAQNSTAPTRISKILKKLEFICNRIRCKSRHDSKSGCTIDVVIFLFFLIVWLGLTTIYIAMTQHSMDYQRLLS
ncbi:hypothetical protein SNE40_002341 [Patella caerulea]|uniref:Uncharacterized protein n=1 Tax=Patella caerulea TaxID=87958 RepID=A0AAN8KDC9_PATCE